MANFNVTFDIFDAFPHGNYLQAKDDNGSGLNYSYLFAGGGDTNHPGVVTVSKSQHGNSIINVSCAQTDLHYAIQRVKIYNNSMKRPQDEVPVGSDRQFNFTIRPDRRSVDIFDRAFDHPAFGDFYYTIMVFDTRDAPGVNKTLPINCDPTIHNVAPM